MSLSAGPGEVERVLAFVRVRLPSGPDLRRVALPARGLVAQPMLTTTSMLMSSTGRLECRQSARAPRTVESWSGRSGTDLGFGRESSRRISLEPAPPRAGGNRCEWRAIPGKRGEAPPPSPRFLLVRFARPDSERERAMQLDVRSGKNHWVDPGTAASRTRFYRLIDDDGTVHQRLEFYLSRVENHSAPAIERMINHPEHHQHISRLLAAAPRAARVATPS